MTQSELERRFEALARLYGLPAYEREYRFAPPRRWRIDCAWPTHVPPVAVELEGGTFAGGRHTRGTGYAADCVKYNEMARRGWRLYRFTAGLLDSDPDGCMAMVREALGGEGDDAK